MQKNFYFCYTPKQQQIDISQYVQKIPVCEWKLDDKTLDSIQIKMLMIENEYYKNKCKEYESELNKMQNIIKKYEKDDNLLCQKLTIPSLD
jgi:hypothetical protein